MPCDPNKVAAGSDPTYDSANDPRLIGQGECLSDVNTHFFYSNKPEALNGVDIDNGVLWRSSFSGTSRAYRIFLWHRNDRDAPIRLGITV